MKLDKSFYHLYVCSMRTERNSVIGMSLGIKLLIIQKAFEIKKKSVGKIHEWRDTLI